MSHSKMLDAYGTSTVTMAPRYNRADKILGAGEVDFWQTSLDTGNRFIGTAFQPSHSTAMRPSRDSSRARAAYRPIAAADCVGRDFLPSRTKMDSSGVFPSSVTALYPIACRTVLLPLHQLSVHLFHKLSVFLSTNYPSILSITIRLSSPSLSVSLSSTIRLPFHHHPSPLHHYPFNVPL